MVHFQTSYCNVCNEAQIQLWRACKILRRARGLSGSVVNRGSNGLGNLFVTSCEICGGEAGSSHCRIIFMSCDLPGCRFGLWERALG